MALRLTPSELAAAVCMPLKRATLWTPYLSSALDLAEINTDERLVDFLAQVGHESGSFRFTQEIWGPTRAQLRYEPTTTLSKRLGNVRPGDGRRFAGHGLIQTTGRSNHYFTTVGLQKLLGDSVPNFVAAPLLLCEPEWAALSGAWFWLDRKLNRFSDSGDFVTLTKRINGGLNGIADRQARRTRVMTTLLGRSH